MDIQLHKTLNHYEKLLQFANTVAICPICEQKHQCRKNCEIADRNLLAFINIQSARRALGRPLA